MSGNSVQLGAAVAVALLSFHAVVARAEELADTRPLTVAGDLALEMVAGIDAYLMQATAACRERRARHWRPDFSSPEAYAQSVEANRKRFARIIGAVDARRPVVEMELPTTTTRPARLVETQSYSVDRARWAVLDGVDAEGLLLTPRGRPIAQVVAMPDADVSPEMLAGLLPGVEPAARFACRLAENGCRVLVPTLIDRRDTWSGNPAIRMTNQPHREFIYRMAFEMGRHIIGYEVQKVLAAVDWFRANDETGLPVGVMGHGEGGLIALYAAAVDPRIDAACVSGYFGPREGLWQEPVYRNIWGLLDEFGDAEIASLIAPRPLVVEAARGPEVAGPPPAREGRRGGAPGRLTSPPAAAVAAEFGRAKAVYDKLSAGDRVTLVVPTDATSGPGTDAAMQAFLRAMGSSGPLRPAGEPPTADGRAGPVLRAYAEARQRRQFDQLVEYTQRLVRESSLRRREFWSKADASSPEKWQASCAFYRDYLWDEVIGRCPPADAPANPRSRRTLDQPGFTGYDVVLDVYPGVYAYGVLLLPKDLKPGERRPVVVCQHGLEGRPQVVVDRSVPSEFYNWFGAKLADRGFIVFAPQNPYIGDERFRVLQRKANPLKLSLFSFIVRQHERILEWLAGRPFVDPKRIGLYGLSYGGKTAMRVPALLPQYCLSICSGDFNEWIVKMTSIDLVPSYMFVHEYEMYEFDMGNTFNYAELAGLIFPRPFMVERGHHDPVGIDEMVAWEYAKVRRFYTDLGLADRTCIEFFPGRHEIHGVGTFEFLHKHLAWPVR